MQAHSRFHRKVTILVTAVVVLLLATAASGTAAGLPPTSGQPAQQDQNVVVIQRDNVTGLARLVEVQGGGQGGPAAPGVGEPETYARAFLAANGALFGLTDQAAQLRLESVQVDALGQRHVRMAQQQDGLPVFGAQVVVHLAADGTVLAANASSVQAPTAAAAAAAQAALISPAEAAIQAAGYADVADGVAAASELVLLNPGLITGDQTPTYLTYRIRVDSPTQPERARWIFVDARDGTLAWPTRPSKPTGCATPSICNTAPATLAPCWRAAKARDR